MARAVKRHSLLRRSKQLVRVRLHSQSGRTITIPSPELQSSLSTFSRKSPPGSRDAPTQHIEPVRGRLRTEPDYALCRMHKNVQSWILTSSCAQAARRFRILCSDETYSVPLASP